MESFKTVETESPFQERITQHSQEFDQVIEDTQLYSPEEVKEAWQVREWVIDGMEVTAVGVMHVPETFLEYRKEIEKYIKESDVVVNEFAPEALGFYDEDGKESLSQTSSLLNDDYTLEDLRQVYLKNERIWNIGTFHHEVEVLAAKYEKPMAVIDLTHSRFVEDALQHQDLYVLDKQKKDKSGKDLIHQAGYAVSSAAVLQAFLHDFQKPMTRRKFLLHGGIAAAGVVLGGTTAFSDYFNPEYQPKKIETSDDFNNEIRTEYLRDFMLAENLIELSRRGYKKVAFIYGTNHLEEVESILENFGSHHVDVLKSDAAKINPDSFKLFKQVEGQNHINKQRFAASRDKIWKEVE